MRDKFIREAISSGPGSITKSDGKHMVRLIVAGVGSSGHYSESMLQRDAASAFPKGTRIYMNHPTDEELYQRPERDIRMLGGYTTEDAVYRDGAVYAPAKFAGEALEIVDNFGPVIAMSIRADGEFGETDENGVPEVLRLKYHPLNSVDIVTVGGAGGGIEHKLAESLRTFGSESTVALAEEENETKGSIVAEKDILDAITGLRDVLTEAVNGKVEKAKAEAEAEVNEKAVEEAVEKAVQERVEVIAAADVAIESAKLLPSQVKFLKESARKGFDITKDLESAKAIAQEALDAAGAGFTPVVEAGRFSESATAKTVEDVIPRGW